MPALSEKEFTVIDRIGNNGSELTQCQIAQHAGLSLGLTNLILKKLTRKGYIKITHLTPKKMHYILTRKGMIEKAEKSYRYVCRTVREMRRIEGVVSEVLKAEYLKGIRVLGIIGDGELEEVIYLCSRDIQGLEAIRLNQFDSDNNTDGVDIILDCRKKPREQGNNIKNKTINMIDYIYNAK